MGSSNRRRNSIMWLKLVATGVTVLSPFQERSTKGYLVLRTGGSFEPSMRHLNDWPAWRCIMQLEAASIWWCGWGHSKETRPSAYSPQSLNLSGFSDEPTCRSSSSSVSVPLCGALGEEAGGPAPPLHACTYCTQTGSPSSEGQQNLIARSHHTLNEGSCDSVLDPLP